MMFASHERGSIYDALRPPAGHRFDVLIACTYSASLDTILSLPGAMLADLVGAPGAGRMFGAADLAALKRICDRTMIFCQSGAIHPAAMLPPAVIEAEPMVHEVAAPMGGAFHPKLWVMRFLDEKNRPTLRTAVLSRNLTGDRSWDLGLVVDGRPGGAARPSDISDLLRLLPEWSRRAPTANRLALLEDVARQVEHVRWRMPDGLGGPRFQAIGHRPAARWSQPDSDRLLVLSPFLTSRTVTALARTSKDPVAIVSRRGALDRCWPAASGHYARKMVLTPPEEEAGGASSGLHGKALIWESRKRTMVAVGSMNATCAATLGRNVEFMAVFDCTAALGEADFDALLGHEALGAVIQDYEPVDPDAVPAELFDDRPARALLGGADLVLRCEREPGGWRVSLLSRQPLGPGVADLLPNLRYRLATMPAASAAPCGAQLAGGGGAPLPGLLELTQITAFTIFEADGLGHPIAFCRNIEIEGLDDEERRAAVIRALLPDRAGFDSFVRTMLGDVSGPGGAGIGDGAHWGEGLWTSGPRAGLLELLVRCAIDDPDRFQTIRQSIEALGAERLAEIAPDGFMRLWNALAAASGAQ